MKKIIFSAMSLIMCVTVFVSCLSTEGVTPTSTVEAPSKPDVQTKSKPDAIGDVVLNDGSVVAYENISEMSENQKKKAIAVIFYVGTECSNNEETRILGVGLHCGRGTWYKDESNSAISIDKSLNIDTIACQVNGDIGNYTFIGDKDGSDNLSQISAYLKSKGIPDDTGNPNNYSAFNFAKNYKDYKYTTYEKSKPFSLNSIIGSGPESQEHTTNVGDIYKDGWYLPTIAELFQIWKSKDKVLAATSICDSNFCDSDFDTGSSYMSSSQFKNNNPNVISIGDNAYAHSFDFTKGKCTWAPKTTAYDGIPVCVIRTF